jgi:hypothetical protein
VARCGQSLGCLSESRVESVDANHFSGHFSTGFCSTFGTDFITKTLPHHPRAQARRVGDSPNLGPSPPLHQVSILLYPPSLTRPLGYCRTRTLLVPFFRVFPRGGCCHSHLRRQSARPRRCALLTTGGRSFVRPHLSTTTIRRIIVYGWKQDQSRAQFRGPCGLGRSCLGLHRRIRPAIRVSIQ